MRHIRRGTSRVTIPFQLRSTSKVMAQWADQVRRGMLELRDRIPQATGGTGGGGATPTPPLFASVSKDGETWKVRVTNGTVNGVTPTIGGISISTNPAPFLTLTEGDNYLHLIGDFEPSVYVIGSGYAAIGSAGTVSSPEFVLNSSASPSPAEAYPIISGTSATTGNFDIVWAKFVLADGAVTTEIKSGGGNASIVFMPPDLYVAFRNVDS